MKTVDINHALRVYFGADSEGGVRPYGMADRIQAEYGVNSATVQAAINRTLDGLLDVPESTQLDSLLAISSFVEQRVRARRPELDDDVCRAIGNYVSYSYK